MTKAGTANQPLLGVWQGDDLAQLRWVQYMFRDSVHEWIFDEHRTFAGDNALLADRYINTRDPAYYAQFNQRRVFFLDLADENYDFSPAVYSNFKGIFRCYWSDVFKTERVHPFPLGTLNGPSESTAAPLQASKRQYLWSFLGQLNKTSRPEIASELGRLEPHILFATDDVPSLSLWNRVDGHGRRFSEAQCAEIMAQSVFAPSPMGNVNLECWRVYEALAAGAIPIVEKRPRLDYFTLLWGPHPVPAVSSWSEARTLMVRLMSSSEALDRLQRECIEWWARKQHDWRSSAASFIEHAGNSTLQASPDAIVNPQYHQRGWQIRELLRHHNLPAMQRRIRLQLARKLSGGPSRVALGSAKTHD